MKRICSIYRSPLKRDTYLYVDKREALTRVPPSLLTVFGRPQLAFDMLLEPQRKLAQADAQKVLQNIAEQGYHLQLPPPEEAYVEHLPEELLRLNDP